MYPHELDCVWLASNARGEVAAFITAGVGPIPAEVLSRGNVAEMENEVLQSLPRSANATVLVTVPKPQSFRDLAMRGLFVYDWTDSHRVRAEAIGAYELVATPDAPLHSSSLPPKLSAWTIALPTKSFERTQKVDGATS